MDRIAAATNEMRSAAALIGRIAESIGNAHELLKQEAAGKPQPPQTPATRNLGYAFLLAQRGAEDPSNNTKVQSEFNAIANLINAALNAKTEELKPKEDEGRV